MSVKEVSQEGKALSSADGQQAETPESAVARGPYIGQFEESELIAAAGQAAVSAYARSHEFDQKKILGYLKYLRELRLLQVELVKFQRDIVKHDRRVMILFEGRDAAGKGGAIKRFTAHLNPRAMQVVALPKPTELEKGQWYFQRYVRYLPNPGEISFFDRSWYNRAVVEPVNGFCSEAQYQAFMEQVPMFEEMLLDDGIEMHKLWFSITREEQVKRFQGRKRNPLKTWKLSPVDEMATQLWDSYTRYKEAMFQKTHSTDRPWIILQGNSKRTARLEAIRHVLRVSDYDGKADCSLSLEPNPKIVQSYSATDKRP
jgi:polyphosphate kinase 2